MVELYSRDNIGYVAPSACGQKSFDGPGREEEELTFCNVFHISLVSETPGMGGGISLDSSKAGVGYDQEGTYCVNFQVGPCSSRAIFAALLRGVVYGVSRWSVWRMSLLAWEGKASPGGGGVDFGGGRRWWARAQTKRQRAAVMGYVMKKKSDDY